MANMTLSMPDDVQEKMKQFPEVKWSEVARRAIIEKVEMLDRIEKIMSKSKLTQKDIDEIGRKVKAGAAEKFMKDARERGFLK